MNILIIDDNPSKVEKMKASLEGLIPGVYFYDADNGKRAQRMLKKHPGLFNLIVLDMQFPEGGFGRGDFLRGGLHFLEYMRITETKIPVFIASSADASKTREIIDPYGYQHIHTICTSSMYDMDGQFKGVFDKMGIEYTEKLKEGRTNTNKATGLPMHKLRLADYTPGIIEPLGPNNVIDD